MNISVPKNGNKSVNINVPNSEKTFKFIYL